MRAQTNSLQNNQVAQAHQGDQLSPCSILINTKQQNAFRIIRKLPIAVTDSRITLSRRRETVCYIALAN